MKLQFVRGAVARMTTIVARLTAELLRLLGTGLVDKIAAVPKYRGESFIPCKLLFEYGARVGPF